MDMSFANQALCAKFLGSQGNGLEKTVHPVPHEIDRRIARLKLDSMGVHIDELTREQISYLASWEMGT
jgi:adenosylhomocysteinase